MIPTWALRHCNALALESPENWQDGFKIRGIPYLNIHNFLRDDEAFRVRKTLRVERVFGDEEVEENFRTRLLPTLPRLVQTFLRVSKLLKIVKPQARQTAWKNFRTLQFIRIKHNIQKERYAPSRKALCVALVIGKGFACWVISWASGWVVMLK